MEERAFDTVEKAKRNLVQQCGLKRRIYTATYPARETVYCVSANATIARSDAGCFWRIPNRKAIKVGELDYDYNDPDDLESIVWMMRNYKERGGDKTWLMETLEKYPEFYVLFDN